MDTVRNALFGTPLWVWALLVFLIFVGVRSLKPSIVGFPRLALLPTVFLVWGLTHLVTTFAPTPLSIGAWVAAFALGIGLGFWLVSRLAVRADKVQGLVGLPGSVVNLVIILLIFATKYVFGYLEATRPLIIANPTFLTANLGVSGLLTGILVGRFWGLWQKYRSAPHTDLATR